MRLLNLAVRNFRNLHEQRIALHPRFNLLAGPNAQGKTNVLEAIFALSATRSFRTSRHKELIAFDADEAVIVADLERLGAERTLRMSFGRSRRAWVNDQPLRRLSDVLGHCHAVLFAPEDVGMLRGSPGDRRRFLDRVVFNARAAYLEELSRYNENLKHRNALLRDERPRQDLLAVYDEQLCALGARVLASRLLVLSTFHSFFVQAFEEIFGAGGEVDYAYAASWTDAPVRFGEGTTPPSVEALHAQLETALAARRSAELRRGVSLVGPHRDDLEVILDGHPIREHASQGQHRAAVLALKISEINMLRERFALEPVLLLDDVSSELDARRNEQLFAFLASFAGQVFITTTSRAHIPITEDVRCWSVRDGALIEA